MHVENLFPGDIVTVMRGQCTSGRTWWGMSYTRENVGFNGDVFRVLAVSPPYVAVELVVDSVGTKHHEKRLSLDSRLFKFAKLDREFLEAMTGGGVDVEPRRAEMDHKEDAAPYSIPQFLNPTPAGRAMGMGMLKPAPGSCKLCGGRDWEHASTCKNNPKRRSL